MSANSRPRLIPVLLLDRDQRLVKTVSFQERSYIGDPFNVLRLFNEKEVDEIVLLDIDASRDGRQPDFEFLGRLASECFMPLAYGGGLSTVTECVRLNSLGIDKFVFGTGATNLQLIAAAASTLGSQSIIGCVDYRRNSAGTGCAIRSGTTPLPIDAIDHARLLQKAGAGEIMLQSIDRDGQRDGYDLDAITRASATLDVPLIALGGAGNLEHLAAGIAAGASAAASGSAFCFIGKLRAVLITYPTAADWAAS